MKNLLLSGIARTGKTHYLFKYITQNPAEKILYFGRWNDLIDIMIPLQLFEEKEFCSEDFIPYNHTGIVTSFKNKKYNSNTNKIIFPMDIKEYTVIVDEVYISCIGSYESLLKHVINNAKRFIITTQNSLNSISPELKTEILSKTDTLYQFREYKDTIFKNQYIQNLQVSHYLIFDL